MLRADLGESSIHRSHGQVVAGPVHKALVGSRSLLLLLPAMHTATAEQHAHTLPHGSSTLSNLGLSNGVHAVPIPNLLVLTYCFCLLESAY